MHVDSDMYGQAEPWSHTRHARGWCRVDRQSSRGLLQALAEFGSARIVGV